MPTHLPLRRYLLHFTTSAMRSDWLPEIEAGTDMYQEPVFEKGASDFKGLGTKGFFITKKDMICDAY